MFAVHSGLRAGTRLPLSLLEQDRIRGAELMVWIIMGMMAAIVSALPEFSLRIPGHAILRSVLPMSLGLAAAPRHMGGAVMGCAGLMTGLGLKGAGIAELGAGALTSLALTGPLLDLVLWRARRGWQLYLGVISAGLLANLAALAVKATEKLALQAAAGGRGTGGGLGLGNGSGGGKRAFGVWLADAAWTYPVCGILAGLISALVWFRWQSRWQESAPDSGTSP